MKVTPRLWPLVAVSVVAVSAAACTSNPTSSGTSPKQTPSTTSASSTTTQNTIAASPTSLHGAQPVWLCRPGLPSDPCVASLAYTAVAAGGSKTSHGLALAVAPKVDCFYVYPTVSSQTTVNANLEIQSAETGVAHIQAAPFSADCDVWAPMYRQATLQALNNPGELVKGDQVAFASLLSAWKDYLANDNQGRPFVLIGHSQGAAMLIRLIKTQIDDDPSLRSRLVSAIILGGNVTVPVGKLVGGSFQHVPACTSVSETECVTAYSSFLDAPPSNSLFGRPGQGVSFMSNQMTSTGLQVLCVNPADPGGSATIQPLFANGAGWVTYPGLYSASCVSRGGATWLQVDVHQGAGDTRPLVKQLGPTWGLHLYDPTMTMLNLVAMVHAEITHYLA